MVMAMSEREYYVLITNDEVTTVHGPFSKEDARETYVTFHSEAVADDVELAKAPPEETHAWEARTDLSEYRDEDGAYRLPDLEIATTGSGDSDE